jgi:two-component system response regulator RegA
MSPRILVVDDDPVFAAALARSLARRGACTETAADGAAALRAVAAFAPTHVVLDLKLGPENGIDVLRALLAARADLHVLLLTGYASLATAVEAVKLGACNYLAKPVDAQAVLAAFGDAIARPAVAAVAAAAGPVAPTRGPSLKRLEWEHIQRVLAECDGNVSAAARRLGLHRRTLQRKLGKRPARTEPPVLEA